MIIRVQDERDREKYCVEAVWIRWNHGENSLNIAIHTRSKTGFNMAPSMYLHFDNGDYVWIISNAGKTLLEKRIIIGAENRKAYREAQCEARGFTPSDENDRENER